MLRKAVLGLSFRQIIVIILAVLSFIIIAPIVIKIAFNTESAGSIWFDETVAKITIID